jgi:hypothetical protein
VKILEGEGVKIKKLKEEAEEELIAETKEHGLTAFPLVVTTPKFYAGAQTLIQAFGIGPLKANTILINWIDQPTWGIIGIREQDYARHLRAGFRLGCNIIVLDMKNGDWPSREDLPSQKRGIDVWWRDDETGRLMLLLAYLMTRSEDWEDSKIRVLASHNDKDPDEAMEDLRKVLDEGRIGAEPEIVGHLSADVISENSSETTLVFLPFRIKGAQLVDPFGGQLEGLLSRLPVVALVLAAEDIDLDAEPEEGKVGELAAALDVFADAEKKAREAEKAATTALEEAEKKLKEMDERIAAGGDESLKKDVKAALEARDKATEAARRAAKASIKAEEAARVAEKLGAKPPDEKKDSKET